MYIYVNDKSSSLTIVRHCIRPHGGLYFDRIIQEIRFIFLFFFFFFFLFTFSLPIDIYC